MSQTNFPILNTPDKNLQLIQANIQAALVAIQLSPFIGGNYLTNIAMTSGVQLKIPHKLGRTPIIWTLGDLTGPAAVWRDAWDTTTITLNANANCMISIWVN